MKTKTQKLYKFTSSYMDTGWNSGARHLKWGPGVCHCAVGRPDQPLCTSAWIHAYTDPVLAVMVDQVFGGYNTNNRGRLWEAEGLVQITDGLKVGCRKIKTLVEMAIPPITPLQFVRFAHICTESTCRFWESYAANRWFREPTIYNMPTWPKWYYSLSQEDEHAVMAAQATWAAMQIYLDSQNGNSWKLTDLRHAVGEAAQHTILARHVPLPADFFVEAANKALQ